MARNLQVSVRCSRNGGDPKRPETTWRREQFRSSRKGSGTRDRLIPRPASPCVAEAPTVRHTNPALSFGRSAANWETFRLSTGQHACRSAARGRLLEHDKEVVKARSDDDGHGRETSGSPRGRAYRGCYHGEERPAASTTRRGR